uniref:Putative ovule protein n=1 Tax=Solanum chacoense TaxID=4108 RepID=A0A0V0HPM0_SOLCH
MCSKLTCRRTNTAATTPVTKLVTSTSFEIVYRKALVGVRFACTPTFLDPTCGITLICCCCCCCCCTKLINSKANPLSFSFLICLHSPYNTTQKTT